MKYFLGILLGGAIFLGSSAGDVKANPLKSLSVTVNGQNQVLSPTFNSATKQYSITIPKGTKNLTIKSSYEYAVDPPLPPGCNEWDAKEKEKGNWQCTPKNQRAHCSVDIKNKLVPCYWDTRVYDNAFISWRQASFVSIQQPGTFKVLPKKGSVDLKCEKTKTEENSQGVFIPCKNIAIYFQRETISYTYDSTRRKTLAVRFREHIEKETTVQYVVKTNYEIPPVAIPTNLRLENRISGQQDDKGFDVDLHLKWNHIDDNKQIRRFELQHKGLAEGSTWGNYGQAICKVDLEDLDKNNCKELKVYGKTGQFRVRAVRRDDWVKSGWSDILTVTETNTEITQPPSVTTESQTIYVASATEPTIPSGGQNQAEHIPTGWSTSRPDPDENVYSITRTIYNHDGVFNRASAWGNLVLVEEKFQLPPKRTKTDVYLSLSDVEEVSSIVRNKRVQEGSVVTLYAFLRPPEGQQIPTGPVTVPVKISKVQTQDGDVSFEEQPSNVVSGSIVISKGSNKGSISIYIKDNAVGTNDEIFVVSLARERWTNINTAYEQGSVRDVNITIEGSNPEIVQFQKTTETVIEGSSKDFIIEGLPGHLNGIALSYNLQTTESEDFEKINPVSLVTNRYNKKFSIQTNHDSDCDDETFTISLTQQFIPLNYVLGERNSITVTIKDDDKSCTDEVTIPTVMKEEEEEEETLPEIVELPTIDFQSDNISVTEGTDTSVDFVIQLSKSVKHEVRVEYNTEDGTAKRLYDFVSLPRTNPVSQRTLIFRPGETQKTVSVPIIDDKINEETEVFYLVLSNPVGAELGISRATATITNHDPLPAQWLSLHASTIADFTVEALEQRFSTSDDFVDITVNPIRRLEFSDPITEYQISPNGAFRMSVGDYGGGARSPSASHLTIWGRMTTSSATREHLSGDITSGTAGLDMTRDRLTFGVLATKSRGRGIYDDKDEHHMLTKVNIISPYVHYRLTDDINLWALVGKGRGQLTLDEHITPVGIRMGMISASGQHKLDTLFLSFKADIYQIKMSSDKVDTIKAAEADIRRSRFSVDGTWDLGEAKSFSALPGNFTPSLGVEAINHSDKPDSLKVSGELRWNNDRLSYGATAYNKKEGEWEVGLFTELTPDEGKGLSFVLNPRLNDDKEKMLTAKVGYGMKVGKEFIGTPSVSLEFNSKQDEVYGLGYTLIGDGVEIDTYMTKKGVEVGLVGRW